MKYSWKHAIAFAVLLVAISVASSGQTSKSNIGSFPASDTTLSRQEVITILTQNLKNIEDQIKQLSDQKLRIEGQIATFSAITTDSVKIRK